MRQIFLFLAVYLSMFNSVQAQCIGNTSWGPASGFYPFPDSPHYSIGQLAFQEPLDFTYTLILDQTPIWLGGTAVFVDSFFIEDILFYDTEKPFVAGLPLSALGLSYQCNAIDCKFDHANASASLPGCINISGTPNSEGNYHIIILAVAHGHFFGTMNFPTQIVIGSPSPISGYINPYPDDRYLLTINPLSNVHQTQETVRLYPNPIQNGILYFDNQQRATGLIQFNVLDAFGQLVAQFEQHAMANENLQFDVSNLPNGMYFYQMNMQAQQYSGKFCINIH